MPDPLDPDQPLPNTVRVTSGGGLWQPPSVEDAARLFPQYEVLALLGRGGMGAVYKARQLALDRFVAIKLLPLEVSADPSFADRFVREARAMGKLNHPNIIAVYDFGQTTEGHLYFAMEFVDGTNLHQIIHGPGLQPAQALAIIGEVCDALAYAHGKGVVHRDMKPANVMVNSEGRVKVADFGLARLTDPGAENLGHTMTGTVMGTPDYMAPEQKRGMNVDHRADIYSLGVMLYEMLCGETPQGIFDPPSHRVPVDARVDQVVVKAMQQTPERRFQSSTEMKAAVDTIRAMPAPKRPAGAVGQAPRLPTTAPGAPQPRTKSNTLLYAGIAAAVVALIGAFIVISRPKPKRSVASATPAQTPKPSATPKFASATAPPSTPTLAPAKAGVLPTSVQTFAGHRYQAVMEAGTWLDAKKKAETMGGHLAVITSAAENDWIRSTIIEQLADTKMLWIGATNSGPDGKLKWLTGDAIAFTNWAPDVDDARLAQARLGAGFVHNDLASGKSSRWSIWPVDAANVARNVGFIVEWDDGPPPAATSGSTGISATKDAPFVNSLGMKFVPVPVTGGQRVLFAVWDTRVQDYAVYAAANPQADPSWKAQDKEGVPIGREQDHPVVAVSWDDAQAFCAWLTAKEQADGKLPPGVKYRLPSDEEWSWAAGLPSETGATPEAKHGKNSVDFPWDKDWPPPMKVGNYADETFHAQFPKPDPANPRIQNKWIAGYTDGHATTSPVGSFPANMHGLHDMGGNVWQWCEDWWNAENKDRVLRGNSFPESNRDRMLSSVRHHTAPGVRYNNHGFRCVLAVSASSSTPAGTPVRPAASDAARDLFNGRDATGWTGPGGAAVTGWTIQGSTFSTTQHTYLWSQESFGDFELELEWKMGPKANGGVFYHVPDGGNELEGPKMQLTDWQSAIGNGWLSGALFGIVKEKRDASKPRGEWNAARLVVAGPKREHWVNGELVASYDVSSDEFKRAVAAATMKTKPNFIATTGKLVLRAYGGEVAYRNARIRTASSGASVSLAATLPATTPPAAASTNDPFGESPSRLANYPEAIRAARERGGKLRAIGKGLDGADVQLGPAEAFDDFVTVTICGRGWAARRRGGDTYLCATKSKGTPNFLGPYATTHLARVDYLSMRLADGSYRNVWDGGSQVRKDADAPGAVAVVAVANHFITLGRGGELLVARDWGGHSTTWPPKDFFLGATAFTATADRYLAAKPGQPVRSAGGKTVTDFAEPTEEVVEMEGVDNAVILLTRSGKVFVTTPDGGKFDGPTADVPAEASPAVRVRIGHDVAAAQRADGPWIAWGKYPDLAAQIAQLKNVVELDIASSKSGGYAIYVESAQPLAEPAKPKAAPEVVKWLSEQEAAFTAQWKSEAIASFESAVAKLREQYAATIATNISVAKKTAKPDELLAWQDEQRRIVAQQPHEGEDAATDPAALKQLRATWRAQFAKLDAERFAKAKAVHQRFDSLLATGENGYTQKQRLDDAALLKSKREEIVKAWLTPPLALSRTVLPETAPATPKPAMGQTLAPPKPVNTGTGTMTGRDVVEWFMLMNGDVSFYDSDGRSQRVMKNGKIEDVPKGRLETHIVSFANKKRDGTNITDLDFQPIGPLRKLTRFEFVWGDITGTGLAFLAGSSDLNTVELRSSGLTAAALEPLLGLRKLHTLILDPKVPLALPRFGELASLPNLETLSLSDAPPGLVKARKLKSFTLTDATLTDAQAAILAALPKLDTFIAQESVVDERGLAELAKSKSLNTLQLRRQKNNKLPPLTPAAIEVLKSLRTVRVLSVQNCGLTPDDFAALRKALPKCMVSGE